MNYYLKKSLKNYRFIIVLSLAITLVLIAIFADYIAPHDPLLQDYDHIFSKPSSKYWLGTDYVGRDMLSRIIYGGRASILISLGVTFIIMVIGIIVGSISALVGGVVDTIIMRIIDMIMAFPYIVFVIAIVSVFGGGAINLVIGMTMISWTNHARVTRATILTMKNSDFIHQARLAGASNKRIIMKYMVPNILPHLIVMTTQDIANNILILSSLSLLGIGTTSNTRMGAYVN